LTGFDTRAVHAGTDPAAHNGAVTTPVYQSSTFVRPRARPVETGWDYSRIANPTRADLEECLAALEGGAAAVAVASGMAACVLVVQALGRSGGHMVIPDNVYGGTWDLMHDVYQRWGLAFTAVDMADAGAVAAAIRPETVLVWAETPSNPLLKITDIAAVASLAHQAGALLAVDGTFASPYLQQPIGLGADLVVHSTTKYLGGHSDITGGAVVAATSELGAVLSRHVGMLGLAAAPQEAWLVRRGIKTLPVRMRQICASSQRIAQYLAGHPAVRRVHYPGLPGHPDHLLAAKQMPRGFGGVISLEVGGGADAAGAVCERARVFTLAVSLGSVESLIEQPARMTHCTTAGTPVSVSDCLVRLSVGLEDCDELIADLDQALAG